MGKQKSNQIKKKLDEGERKDEQSCKRNIWHVCTADRH